MGEVTYKALVKLNFSQSHFINWTNFSVTHFLNIMFMRKKTDDLWLQVEENQDSTNI